MFSLSCTSRRFLILVKVNVAAIPLPPSAQFVVIGNLLALISAPAFAMGMNVGVDSLSGCPKKVGYSSPSTSKYNPDKVSRRQTIAPKSGLGI